MDHTGDTGDYAIPTHNRYDVFNARQISEPLSQTQTAVSRIDFENSSLDSKMVHIFDELRFIRNEQVSCSRGMISFNQSLTKVSEKLGQVVQITNTQTDLMKTLAYKSIDIEARARRNNLIFRGLAENYGENCAQLLRDFLTNHLDIDSQNVYIARAHRLGRRNARTQFQHRPIIANFRDFGDVELIMSRVRLLKGKRFSVDYDYPREIQEARSRLWPKYKELKREFPRSRIQMVYPAKLIHDGRLVCDEMPDWNVHMNASRIRQINTVSNVSGVRGPSPQGPPEGQPCDHEYTAYPLPIDIVNQQVLAVQTENSSSVFHSPSAVQTHQLSSSATQMAMEPPTANNMASMASHYPAQHLAQQQPSCVVPNSQHPQSCIAPITHQQPNCVAPTSQHQSTENPTDMQVEQHSSEQTIAAVHTTVAYTPAHVNSTGFSVSFPQGLNSANTVDAQITVDPLLHTNSDETVVKSLQCDASNPVLISSNEKNLERGRSRVARTGSQRRTQSRQSSAPYTRQNSSQKRAAADRSVSRDRNTRLPEKSNGHPNSMGPPQTSSQDTTDNSVSNQNV